MLRGSAQTQLGNLPEAIVDYTFALELNHENADAYYNRARAHVAAGNAMKAVLDYSMVIERRPADAEARLGRGILLLALGLHPQALTDFDTTLILNPSLAQTHWNRAFLLHELDRWDEAQVNASQATQLNPANAQAWMLLGRIEFRRRQYDAAITAYDHCLALDRKQAEAFLYRGEAKRVQGFEKEACKDWKQVLKYDQGELARKAQQWHEIVCE